MAFVNKSVASSKAQLHYGWIIAFIGTTVIFCCLGLGRFSLGMLLPSMGNSLDLNYSQMGLIGTGNFVGYMISVVLAGIIAGAIGARWTISMGLVLVGGSMLFISRAMGFLEVMALFGATYAVYATFIVTVMVNERDFGENTAGIFWAAVGGLSIFSGPLFGWLSDRLGRKTGMMLVYTLFTISYALAGANLPNPFLYASIGIFGLAVWSIPTIMAATVGDYTGPVQAVKAFGFITLFFGAGQIIGPSMAGLTADITGTFSMAFWLCALLTASAVVLTYFLRPTSEP
ncbi:MAG: MFS transporter [Desulfobacteraceae bacterium]|jgi:MFS family permease